MSLEVISLEEGRPKLENLEYKNSQYSMCLYYLQEGWLVWKKYFSHIPSKEFSLISYPSLLGQGHLEIAIINHEQFLRVVEKNIVEFHSVLKKELEPSEILKEYIKAEGEIFQAIHSHDGLTGILLGYGKENAWQFLNKGSLTGFVEFSDLNFEDMNQVLLPLFKVIEDTEETRMLRCNYQKQREFINQIYRDKFFLELVMKRIFH